MAETSWIPDEERVDMSVEVEGPEMEYLRILRRLKKAFQAGYGMGLNSEQIAKVTKEKAKQFSARNPESADNVLEFSADLMDVMPVGIERKSQLKAYILTEEMPLAS